MANNMNKDGNTGIIIGGVVIIAAVLGYLYYTGNLPGVSPAGDMTATTPSSTMTAPTTTTPPAKK